MDSDQELVSNPFGFRYSIIEMTPLSAVHSVLITNPAYTLVIARLYSHDQKFRDQVTV